MHDYFIIIFMLLFYSNYTSVFNQSDIQHFDCTQFLEINNR